MKIMMNPPKFKDYDNLLSCYASKLKFAKDDSENADFSLVFGQIIRLLRLTSDFNRNLPRPFVFVARKYGTGEPEICKYFQYNENRKFFLSDLYDYLQIHKKMIRQKEEKQG